MKDFYVSSLDMLLCHSLMFLMLILLLYFMLQVRSDTRKIGLQEARCLRIEDQPGKQNRQS